jgi:uncharacterized membrane protein (DUF373 family)
MDAKNLQPFINKDLRALIKKIQYKDKKKVVKSGFNALILPEVADLYLTAREQGVISSKQRLDTAYKAALRSLFIKGCRFFASIKAGIPINLALPLGVLPKDLKMATHFY